MANAWSGGFPRAPLGPCPRPVPPPHPPQPAACLPRASSGGRCPSAFHHAAAGGTLPAPHPPPFECFRRVDSGGECGAPRGEGGRKARRQGCLGRRSSPGTWRFPRSLPPARAPRPLFYTLRKHSTRPTRPQSFSPHIVTQTKRGAPGTAPSPPRPRPLLPRSPDRAVQSSAAPAPSRAAPRRAATGRDRPRRFAQAQASAPASLSAGRASRSAARAPRRALRPVRTGTAPPRAGGPTIAPAATSAPGTTSGGEAEARQVQQRAPQRLKKRSGGGRGARPSFGGRPSVSGGSLSPLHPLKTPSPPPVPSVPPPRRPR